MNEELKKAMEINEYGVNLPIVEVDEITTLGHIWDGNGEIPTEDYSYQLNEIEWLNYTFEVIEEKEDKLDTIIRIESIDII